MTIHAPWNDPTWWVGEMETIRSELASVGCAVTGALHPKRRGGRSALSVVETSRGPVWIKHAYRLPPGEEVVLAALAPRHPGRVPEVITTWPGAVALAPLAGRSLEGSPDRTEWEDAARLLGEIAARERDEVTPWLERGVRDRRAPQFRAEVEALVGSPTVEALESSWRREFEVRIPEWTDRFEAGFRSPASLVHQDSGDCNLQVTAGGPILYDWSDVVIGHPVFSCDRLLDQVPSPFRDGVIEAFRAPLELSADEFRAMRRSNVLHEILRYHDELAYLPPGDPQFLTLERAVQSQIRVLVDHERRRSSSGP